MTTHHKTIRQTAELDRWAAWDARKARERAAKARGLTEYEIRLRARDTRQFWARYIAAVVAVVLFVIL